MKKFIVFLIVLALTAVPAFAADWTGGGDGVSWSDPANWDGDPTGDTVNINGPYTIIVDVDDSINSIRMGDGAHVTIPAGITLSDNDTSESSGLGWWSGVACTLVIEGTFAFEDNNGNLWLSDMWDSADPDTFNTMMVIGDGVCRIGGETLAARDDAKFIIGDNATVDTGNNFLIPYHDFGGGELNGVIEICGNPTITTTSNVGFGGDSAGTFLMTGGTVDCGGLAQNGNDSFTLDGGKIIMNGSHVGFAAANSWFDATCPGYTETEDGGRTTLDCHRNINCPFSCNLLTLEGEVKVYEDSGEGSMTGTFTVALASQPGGSTDIITVTLDPNGVGDDDDDVTVAPGALAFTSADWDTPQTVTVTAIDDNWIDSGYIEDDLIRLTPVSANGDPNFNCSQTQAVTIYDDEAAGILVLPTSVSVAEGGSGDSFTVVLRSPPSDPVTVEVGSTSQSVVSETDPNLTTDPLDCQATVNGGALASLVFNSGNYETPQTVNVAAVDDGLYETDPHSIIIGTHVYTEDATYSTKSASDVDVTITENDIRGWSFGDPGASIPLVNYSFEDPCLADGGSANFDADNPVPGYDYWVMNDMTVVNPTAAEWAAMYNAGHQQAPDGEQVLDMASEAGAEAAPDICTEYKIEPGPVSYSFEFAVGVPEPSDAGASVTVYLSSNDPAAFGRIADPPPTFSLAGGDLVAGEWVNIKVCGIVEADSSFVGGTLSVGVVAQGVQLDNWQATVGNYPCDGCYAPNDPTAEEGDLDDDCDVDLADFAIMAAHYLECATYPGNCVSGW